MAVTTIPWGDGSGDNIYLTYSSASGNQTVEVTSDANTGGIERSKNIIFTAVAGPMTITQTLTVTQRASAGNFIVITYNDTAISHNNTVVGYEQ